MYKYRRFRTSKSAVTIILIVLALVTWGILGLTGTPLAKKGGGGKATFEVALDLTGSGGTVNFVDGEAQWPVLAAHFKGDDDTIQVGGVDVDLIGLTLEIRHGEIIAATVFFQDSEGTVYHTPSIDVGQPKPDIPEKIGGSFTVYIGESGVDVIRQKRGRGTVLGTVDVWKAEYTRTK